jgi:hypothetical protein
MGRLLSWHRKRQRFYTHRAHQVVTVFSAASQACAGQGGALAHLRESHALVDLRALEMSAIKSRLDAIEGTQRSHERAILQSNPLDGGRIVKTTCAQEAQVQIVGLSLCPHKNCLARDQLVSQAGDAGALPDCTWTIEGGA